MNKESVLIGKTTMGSTIEICAGCEAYPDIPHFFYCYRSWFRKRAIVLRMDKPEPLDSTANLELRCRRDLQQFLTPENWNNMITGWNQHHAYQIDKSAHVPYYINLLEMRDYTSCAIFNEEYRIPDGDSIRIYGNDSDQRPHFHYAREDGTEAAISLKEPMYLGKAATSLSPHECAMLSTFIRGNSRFADTVYHAMLSCWKIENGSDKIAINDSSIKPIDYNLLRYNDDMR